MGLLSDLIGNLRSLASPKAVRGHLGQCEGRVVSGWAMDPSDPSAQVCVSIRANGVLLGTAVANKFREDLKAAGVGLGHGKYAFGFRLPPEFRPAASFRLSAEVEGRSELRGSPLRVEQMSDETIIGSLDGCNDGTLYGWAMDTMYPDREISVLVEHDGRELGTVVAHIFREDLRRDGVGLGHGQYGFLLPIPAELRALGIYTLTASAKDGPPLSGSPMTITENVTHPFRIPGPAVRSFLGTQYLQGEGIEIGALTDPMRVPAGCSVRYVDAFTTEELRRIYPARLQGYELVEIDIVTDAHVLTGVADGSQDFVIANHVLEHLENPLLALNNMLRVLRTGGVLFLALPDKRHSFDKDRPCTTFEHILEDYQRGPGGSRKAHYLEWIRLVEKVPEPEVEDRLRVLMDELQYSIHFHVWSQFEVLSMLDRAREVLTLRYEIECFKANGDECISVLRKQPD